jgi:predicted N-acetyltransferase YhbS
VRTGSLAATLAIVDGDTVAMAVTTPQDKMLEMLALVVDESHRRHRIGQALAEHVLAAARAGNYTAVVRIGGSRCRDFRLCDRQSLSSSSTVGQQTHLAFPCLLHSLH